MFFMEKWIQEREDYCMKGDELTMRVKLLRKGGIQAKMGKSPSILRGKMENADFFLRNGHFSPNPSILFEL